MAAGHGVRFDDEIPGVRRCYVDDPFGNRIELIECVTRTRTRVPKPTLAGSSIGRTPDFGSGGWRFEPSPASKEKCR